MIDKYEVHEDPFYDDLGNRLFNVFDMSKLDEDNSPDAICWCFSKSDGEKIAKALNLYEIMEKIA